MSGFDLRGTVTGFLDGEVPAQLSAWLATYLVHGVCLFFVAAVAVRVIKSARASEQLWRAALFGPLVTASLQLGAGWSPAFGQWDLPNAMQQSSETPLVATAPVKITYLEALEGQEQLMLARIAKLGDELALIVDGPIEGAATNAPAAAHSPATLEPEPHRPFGAVLALPILALGIAALMLRALLEAVRMHRLGRRSPLSSGPIVNTVRSLARRAGIKRTIRVEVTAFGASPYATGVLFPKIIVPERAIAELDAASMQAMLAHEIGHVARFDPLWTAAARSVATLFFLQPLNWFLVRRLDECAEYCCDEFAVDVTGNEVALARCLTTVAEWIIGGSSNVRAACPMAHRNSPLASRVNRILATEGQPRRPLGVLRCIGGAVVLTTAMAAPGFAARTAADTAKSSPAAPDPQAPAGPTRLIVETPSTPASSEAVFEALELSIAGLSGEIEALIAVARQRDVSTGTMKRLTKMHAWANHVRSQTRVIQQRIARDAR